MIVRCGETGAGDLWWRIRRRRRSIDVTADRDDQALAFLSIAFRPAGERTAVALRRAR